MALYFVSIRHHGEGSGDVTKRRLAAARILWLGLALLGLGILIGTFIANRAATAPGEPVLFAALDAALALGYLTAALAIFWRRSDDPIALLFSAMLLTLGVTNAVITNHPDPGPTLRAFEILTDFLSLLVLYIFPDGRFVPRWTRVSLALWLVYLVANQIGLLPGVATEDLVDLAFWATGIAAMAHRYRRVATETGRQQIKWIFLGGAATILVVYAVNLARFALPLLFGPSAPVEDVYQVVYMVGRTLGLLILPAAVAIAVLRYRLWDIDFYINRGLVYSALTLALGLVFFGTALLLQAALRAALGDARSTVALTAAAVLTAVLFQPTRQALQGFVDRRFYGVRPYVEEAPRPDASAAPLVDPLSEREMDVLRLVDAGLSNRDIADELYISVGTVKWHTNNIYTKLDVSSRTQAAARAREMGILG
jgi:DNA-binding CsgD family transcriptional regulator